MTRLAIARRTLLLLAASSGLLAGCSHEIATPWQPNDYHAHQKKSRYGNPRAYKAKGKVYHVLPTALGYRKRGMASWYGRKFHGKLTSTREVFDMYGITAASPELPIPCFVRVTNLRNHRSLIVKVNDRGPFARHRLIDLSYAAAIRLGYAKRGTAPVLVESIERREASRTLSRLNPPSEEDIYWQTGVFNLYSHAEKQSRRVNRRLHSHKAHVHEKLKHGRLMYQVTVGPLHTLRESDRMYARLKQHGFKQAIPLSRDFYDTSYRHLG